MMISAMKKSKAHKKEEICGGVVTIIKRGIKEAFT